MSSSSKKKKHKKSSKKSSKSSSSGSSKSRSKSSKSKSSKSKSHKKSHSSSRKKSAPEASAVSSTHGDTNLNFEAGRLFGKFDQSQTGKLGKEEFQNLFAHLSQQQQQQQRSSAVARGGNSAFDLGLMFSKYDTDGSGKLNPAKFRALMQNLPNHKPASAQPVPYSHETNGFARPFQTPLLAKKQTVEDHILQLRARMQEISEIRKDIELNATRDYEEIIGRLRSEEAAKLSALQQEIDMHTTTISRIEQVESSMLVHGGAGAPNLTTSPEYLRLYPEIQQLLREHVPLRTVSKHLHDETASRAQKLKASDANAQALRVKDSMIWILLQERKRYESERTQHTDAIDKLSHASSREIEQWIGLVDRVTAELERTRRSVDDLKNRIRDADAALSNNNFAALRQILSADSHEHHELIPAHVNPSSHLSRSMSGLVASSEHGHREM